MDCDQARINQNQAISAPSKPPSKPAIPTEFDRLQAAIAELLGTLALLRGRLVPVMRPQPATAAEQSPPSPPCNTVAQKLDEANGSIGLAIQGTREILELLEI